MSMLTSEQINELKEAFSLFDRNGDGFITIQEINSALESIGIAEDTETKGRLDTIDKKRKNKDKGVDFEEFLELMNPIFADYSSENELIEAFRTFDTKGNNRVPVPIIVQILQEEKFSQQDIDEIIEEMKPTDGEIIYSIFVKNALNH
jgi:calmodulin